MRIRLVVAIQVLLIVVLSCAAAYTFFMSFGYSRVDEAMSDIPGSFGVEIILALATLGIEAFSVIRRRWLPGALWLVVLFYLAGLVPLSVCLGGLSILLGVYLVMQRGLVWAFFGLLAALYFPSVMAFSSADWLWFVSDFEWKTELTTSAMAALSGWLIVGHLILRYTTQVQQASMELTSQGYDVKEVKSWYVNKLVFASLVLLGAAVTTAIILGASVGLDHLLGHHTGGVPLRAVLFGVGGSVVLVGAIYYILVGRKTPGPVDRQETKRSTGLS
jgi:hypothetical protein